MKHRWLILCVFCLLSFFELVFASERYPFQNPEHEKRFHHLIHRLRCMVCQNQTIADSNSPFAEDLRVILHQKILEGESDQAIRLYLRGRYGDYVWYQPPFRWSTTLLWVGPVVALVCGMVMIHIRLRRRASSSSSVR